MNADDLSRELARRAPGQWELYRKTAESRETEAVALLSRTFWRREEGWAARWRESGAPRFAAGSSPEDLLRAIEAAEAIVPEPAPNLEWPTRRHAAEPSAAALEPPPEPFEELSRAVSAAARGEAVLSALTIRRGRVEERIINAAGLDVRQEFRLLDGVATAVGRRGSRAREARFPFRWDGSPDVEGFARRLGDAATLPLSDRPAPFPGGQWLLDPSVGAALLAAAAGLFLAERPPHWLVRGRFGPPGLSIVDDASPDAFADGEGVPTRRVVLAEDGMLVGRLLDLSSAAACGHRSTGHGVRPSYRVPPRAGPRRLFFETAAPVAPADLLKAVSKGLFASALTAPVRVDVAADRYEVEFTGVSIVAGRAGGPVAGARAHGRLSELLRRIKALSTDLQFFPSPYPAGSPTLLIERASFD
ncbi:MAG TPA: metallopeptidase TldD-related protein [Thermoanaerobaculia bacterium]|nr:metallopeptidase TldD-related protein [Thermoanaerobaculia bacterium]